MIKVEDFGLESVFPRFMLPASKNAMMSTFIWFCRLSDIMMAVTIFLKGKSADWQHGMKDFAMPVDEIHQVRAFEAQLEGWRQAYQNECGYPMSQNLPGYCKMQLYTMDIISW
jgi:hypothetical protein